jgi:Fe-S cluster biogenesis protein NfuA
MATPSKSAPAQESGGDDKGSHEQLRKLCRDVLHPLVAADGGELYLVSYDDGDVHLHLAGTCSGCPGVTMTRDRVIEPVLRALGPKMKLKLTAGWTIPPHAEKLG